MTLYNVARTAADQIAPTLTVDQLTERLNQAERIMAAHPEGAETYAAAIAAYDAFERELSNRFPLPAAQESDR